MNPFDTHIHSNLRCLFAFALVLAIFGCDPAQQESEASFGQKEAALVLGQFSAVKGNMTPAASSASVVISEAVTKIEKKNDASWSGGKDIFPSKEEVDTKPTKTTCCKLPDGSFSMLSKPECVEAEGSGAPIYLCKMQQVSLCCETPDGEVSIMLNTECKELNGNQVALDLCDSPAADICCETPDGAVIVPEDECEQVGSPLPMSFCVIDPIEICCETSDGAQTMTIEECVDAGGTPLAMEACETNPDDICCKHPILISVLMSEDECLADNGSVQPMGICDPSQEEVCCETPDGLQILSAEECEDMGAVLPMNVCEPNPYEICCHFPYGPNQITNPTACTTMGGTPVLMELCDPEPEDVCCETPNGAQILPQDDCDDIGAVLPMEFCEEPIFCCETPNGLVLVTDPECDELGGVIVADELCEEPEIICCESPNGMVHTTEDDCLAMGGGVAPESACDELCEFDIDKDASLIVTDADILALFPLEEVMQQLADMGVASGTQTGVELFQQMWSSQRERDTAVDPDHHPFCDDNGGTINGFPIQQNRPESAFENQQPSSHKPTALVNRFDLAPTNGAHCGEYRIVYAFDSAPGMFGRNTIIFEAVLPNPNPGCGLAGCQEVVEFWASLTDEPDVNVRAAQLHDFYMNGLPGFDPVVQPANYGLVAPGTPSGQIRTNQFIAFQSWNLREYILEEGCDVNTGDCELVVQQTTVKGNPSPEVWSGASPLSPAYEASFISQMGLQIPAVEDINNLGMETDEMFNSGESIAQGGFLNSAVYNANPSLDTAIANAIPGSSFLEAQDITARAQTMTCGGCHQTSSNDNLGTNDSLGIDLMWPAQSPSFVHIDENSNLSTALTMPGGFLDRRKQVMEDFLSITCEEPCLEDPILVTVDGGLITTKAFEVMVEDAKKSCGGSTGPDFVPSDKEEAAALETASTKEEANKGSDTQQAEESDTQEAGQSKAAKAAGGKATGQEAEDASDQAIEISEETAEPAPAAACPAEGEVLKTLAPKQKDPLKTTLSGKTTH